jgi:hypothetical protein
MIHAYIDKDSSLDRILALESINDLDNFDRVEMFVIYVTNKVHNFKFDYAEM